jgi:hypothetical protein
MQFEIEHIEVLLNPRFRNRLRNCDNPSLDLVTQQNLRWCFIILLGDFFQFWVLQQLRVILKENNKIP